MTQKVNLLLFDAFSNHCLANLVEPLRAANGLAQKDLYAWCYFSLDGKAVQSSSGLSISPLERLGAETGDILAVMPSYGFRDLAASHMVGALRMAASRHTRLAGLDTGSWLLARAGLLDGHQATIHWDELIQFEETFPSVHVVKERFVIDGNRLTCSGAMAAFDLALALILDAHGPLLAMEVAQLLMSRGTSPSYALPLHSEDTLVTKILTLMQNRLEEPLRISEIAKELGCSQKKIETRVQSELGTTPQALYRRLRLNLVRKLATETDQSIAEITARCGYENASAMTRAFKAEFGYPPSALRAPFREPGADC